MYGLFTSNGWESYIDSTDRMPVLVAYAKVDYDAPIYTTTRFPPKPPNWPSDLGWWGDAEYLPACPPEIASHSLLIVTLKKTFPIQLFKKYYWDRNFPCKDFGWQNSRSTVPIMSYFCCSSGDHAAIIQNINSPGDGPIVESDRDTALKVYYCDDPGGMSDIRMSVRIENKDPSASKTRSKGTLYLAIFTNLPVDGDQQQTPWGFKIYDNNGKCNFNSYYEPMIFHSMVNAPAIANNPLNSWGNAVSIPSYTAGDLYMTQSSTVIAGNSLWVVNNRGYRTYCGMTTHNGKLSKAPAIVYNYGTANIPDKTIDWLPPTSKVPILKVSDYF